jgi:hypothetical protein
MELLKDPETLQDFQLQLSNRFQALQEIYEDDTSNVNSIWTNAKDMWSKSWEETVGSARLISGSVWLQSFGYC